MIKYFSFAFFLFIPFATQLFSNSVTSSILRNQAPLFTEFRLLQGTPNHDLNSISIFHYTQTFKNAFFSIKSIHIFYIYPKNVSPFINRM